MARGPFDEFFRRVWRMLKDFEFGEIELPEFNRQSGVSGFQIDIKDHGTGRPEIKVRRLGERSVKVKPLIEETPELKPVEAPPKIKPIKRMLETNVVKLEKPRGVILTMQVPGVSKSDVEIRGLGQTLEVIARKPNDEAYFAAFELPPNAVLDESSSEIKDGILSIKIPRHRYAGVRT